MWTVRRVEDVAFYKSLPQENIVRTSDRLQRSSATVKVAAKVCDIPAI